MARGTGTKTWNEDFARDVVFGKILRMDGMFWCSVARKPGCFDGEDCLLKNWVEDQEMKVLLIEPPPASKFGNLRTLGSIGTLKADMAWPPLDLMIIAGLLKQHSIPVALYDANSLKATFEDVQKKSSPKSRIWSFLRLQRPASTMIFKRRG